MEKKNGLKHGAVYTCKRLRMVSWLKEHGRYPFEVLPDARNPRFNVFNYHNDSEFESLVEEYFATLGNR